jgi:hypothetical protein
MMRFLIIAVEHNWQLVPHGPETPDMTSVKDRFTKLLNQTIADRRVDLMCEESDPCRLSIAQKVAYEHTPRIPWKNITMSAQERLEVGIYEALLERPLHVINEPTDYHFEIKHRIPEDKIREQFFATEATQEASSIGARSVLMLCGDMHADFLKPILEASQYRVEVNRDLIPRKYWK